MSFSIAAPLLDCRPLGDAPIRRISEQLMPRFWLNSVKGETASFAFA